MTFWSGETLAAKAPSLISPFLEAAIDCSAYTLRIGAEAFVTADQSGGVKDGLKTVLKEGEPFKIPPGQFAFLLTEETVSVPIDAMAFISFKTGQKWLGLVNVSGFHVDPGWNGTLMFGLYNAGPNPVHLTRGMPMFLIWYAQLDRPTAMRYRPSPDKGQPHIPEKYINNMAGQVFSPMVLAKDLQLLRDKTLTDMQSMRDRLAAESTKMGERLHSLEVSHKWTQRLLWASLIGLFTLLVGPVIQRLVTSLSASTSGSAAHTAPVAPASAGDQTASPAPQPASAPGTRAAPTQPLSTPDQQRDASKTQQAPQQSR
jgi:dCTP deaminase